MEKNLNFKYESPEIAVLEMESEGVLCGSNELLKENNGVW